MGAMQGSEVDYVGGWGELHAMMGKTGETSKTIHPLSFFLPRIIPLRTKGKIWSSELDQQYRFLLWPPSIAFLFIILPEPWFKKKKKVIASARWLQVFFMYPKT